MTQIIDFVKIILVNLVCLHSNKLFFTYIATKFFTGVVFYAFPYFRRLRLCFSQNHFVKSKNVSLKTRMNHSRYSQAKYKATTHLLPNPFIPLTFHRECSNIWNSSNSSNYSSISIFTMNRATCIEAIRKRLTALDCPFSKADNLRCSFLQLF